MFRYVFKFEKTGNLRFISHLDLQRLFRRSIKRAQIKVSYTQGFNPHEMINIVEALSLGFESTGDYFEIVTPVPYEPQELMDRFNETFPDGLKFVSAKELSYAPRNLSTKMHSALYEAILPLEPLQELHVGDFISRPEIIIIKKDKKTKKPVQKNVKNFVFSIEETGRENGTVHLALNVRCASNETLNPVSLLASLWSFNGLELKKEEVRILRREMYCQENGRLVPVGGMNE